MNLKYKPNWFLARNPFGLAPVLEKDGQIIYESVVCGEYLDEVYPQNPLTPTEPYVKAKQRILMELFGKVLVMMTFKYNTLYKQ